MARSDLVFYGGASFLLGVFAAGFHLNIPSVLSIAVVGISIGLLTKKFSAAFSLFLLAFLFTGVFYYHLYQGVQKQSQDIVFNQAISFTGIVIEEPSLTETSQRLTLTLQPPLSGRIVVITSRLPEFSYGTLIGLQGIIEYPRLSDENPASFFPNIETIQKHRGFWLKEKLLALKGVLIDQFRKTLPTDSAALLAGLTFGSRSDFTKEFKSEMGLSGTTHLVALSGYNIAILAFVVAHLFGRWFSRRFTFYLTSGIIVLFVLMVGAQPSVIRAAIMGLLVLLARHAGRIYNFRNAVTLAGCLMVLANPTIIARDVGFQLSFVSLLGIVYVAPALKHVFRLGASRDESFLGWRENAITTLGAQLAVFPIIMKTFGQFSLSAFFSNIMILEFVPLTMFLGFFLAVLSIFSFSLGLLISVFVRVLLVYQIAVIKFFAHHPLLVTNTLHPLFLFGFYYAIVAWFVIYSNKNANKKI